MFLFIVLNVGFQMVWFSLFSFNYFLQTVEGHQVDEAVASIFHTVLFHRTLGKFRYKEEGNYSVGTIGYSDVDCDFIDFTYVSIQSVMCLLLFSKYREKSRIMCTPFHFGITVPV